MVAFLFLENIAWFLNGMVLRKIFVFVRLSLKITNLSNVCCSPQKTKVEHTRRKIFFSSCTRIGPVDFGVEEERRREVILSTSIGETFGNVRSYRRKENGMYVRRI